MLYNFEGNKSFARRLPFIGKAVLFIHFNWKQYDIKNTSNITGRRLRILVVAVAIWVESITND